MKNRCDNFVINNFGSNDFTYLFNSFQTWGARGRGFKSRRSDPESNLNIENHSANGLSIRPVEIRLNWLKLARFGSLFCDNFVINERH